MYYIIYETTNIINGVKYIGKHITENVDDGYLGSGMLLVKAIEKYGKEKFTKNILYTFDTETDMNAKEIELVNEKIVKSKKYYNIALGGQGGNIVLYEGHPLFQTTKKKIGVAHRKRSSQTSEISKRLHAERRIGMYGKKQSEYQKKTVSRIQRERIRTPEEIQKRVVAYKKRLANPNYVNPNKGRRKSLAQIEKMKKWAIGRFDGEKNPMYGKKQSAKTKTAISEKAKERNKKKTLCEYCQKQIDTLNYNRWHGDNCKLKELPRKIS